MPASSPVAQLQSRNFESEALRRVASVQYEAIADALGCDKSTVCRMFGERGVKLGEIPLLLDALGWKIVGKDQHCCSRDEFEAYRTLARVALVAEGRKLEQDWESSAT